MENPLWSNGKEIFSVNNRDKVGHSHSKHNPFLWFNEIISSLRKLRMEAKEDDDCNKHAKAKTLKVLQMFVLS